MDSEKNNKISPDDIANYNDLSLGNYLECPIDNMVSRNPLMCKKCETVFCPDCIEDWKKRSNNCPMRCTPIELVNTDKTIIRQQINKIKLFCKNKESGCIEQIPFNEVSKHDTICEYKLKECEKCKTKIPAVNYVDHIYESCNERKIKCPLCESLFNLKDLIQHFEECDKELCKNCCLIDNLHKCNFELKTCKNCSFPDFSCNLNDKIHKCVNDSSYNNYFKNLLIKYETYVGNTNYSDKFREFINRINSIVNEISKLLTDKENLLQNKFKEVKDRSITRVSIMKRDKIEENEKLSNENDEIIKKIEKFNSEKSQLDSLYENKKNILQKEYELKIYSKIQNLEHLRNYILFKPKNEKKTQNERLITSMYCTECMSILSENTKCESCSKYICQRCSKKCPKNNSHANNLYCKNCAPIQCVLCREYKCCRLCIKKCYYTKCGYFFCSTCYDKNKHQIRPENTNCSFYKCESCLTDTNCIMTTLYCIKCDRRICKDCYFNIHKAHNTKIN